MKGDDWGIRIEPAPYIPFADPVEGEKVFPDLNQDKYRAQLEQDKDHPAYGLRERDD